MWLYVVVRSGVWKAIAETKYIRALFIEIREENKSIFLLFHYFHHMIAIVDYGMGNLFSVQRKLEKLGFTAVITNDLGVLQQAKKIILPGVGHFGQAMSELSKRDLISPLSDLALEHKTPFLGICLGMQLMTSGSEEGSCEGLNWFSCNTERLRVKDTTQFKIPHIGWNTIDFQRENAILENIPSGSEMYFVHAYGVLQANENEVLTSTTYETPFISGLQRETIWGMQFHPEKSHDLGLNILYNFASI
jgi:glutamine amidotransferase